MKRTKVEGRGKRNRRALLIKPDSRPVVAEFTEDMLMEILARLPANSLMRFKCVSKLWSSIISSSYFTNLFLKSPSPLRHWRRFYLVDKDGHGHYALLSAWPNNCGCEF
ncbi:hypothetical protein EUTSA_v10010895mg [Eutrema salsugineum]|uniref:F-box domain-containing protein n=1 Tax=Eutrema salsugineum TaxID=72664 RepID=V4NGJ9_EUTSA|nr:hypothetical protein EUTSA_v10010895mg [Eutrema salsugineum]